MSECCARHEERFDRLQEAAEEYRDAVTAYLDPVNQFTDSRRHHVEEARAALNAALYVESIEPIPVKWTDEQGNTYITVPHG